MNRLLPIVAILMLVSAGELGNVGLAPDVNPTNPQDMTVRSNPQDLNTPTGRNPQDFSNPHAAPNNISPE